MLKRAFIVGAVLITMREQRAAAFDPAISGAGRVLIVERPGATQAFAAQAAPVAQLVRAGLRQFVGQPDVRSAWLSMISTQDVVGIKVYSAPGAASGTRKEVVAAVVETLIETGLPAAQIIVWDKRLIDLRLAGYSDLARKYGLLLAGAVDEGFDEKSFYPSPLLGKLVYGDLDFQKRGEGVGRNSYVTKLLTQKVTKIVNITPLLNHNLAGVSGVLFGLAMGSVDNVLRFEEEDRLASAVPEIYAMPEVGDRVVLNIVDALICQYRGEERTLLHYSTVLNQLWFSRDPVALDVLALAELARQKKDGSQPKTARLIYENAALLQLGVADSKRIKTERLTLE